MTEITIDGTTFKIGQTIRFALGNSEFGDHAYTITGISHDNIFKHTEFDLQSETGQIKTNPQ